MANTSVHLPDSLLEELDRLAAERGVSRNRVIVESCRRLLEESKVWPEGLFTNDHLSKDELAELRRSEEDFLEGILESRRSRVEAPF